MAARPGVLLRVLFGRRTQLWWDLPVRESFAVLRDIHGVDAATRADCAPQPAPYLRTRDAACVVTQS